MAFPSEPSSTDAELLLGPSAPSVPGIDLDRNIVWVAVSQHLRVGRHRRTDGSKGKEPGGAGARLESVRHWRTQKVRDRCERVPAARNRANTGDTHPGATAVEHFGTQELVHVALGSPMLWELAAWGTVHDAAAVGRPLPTVHLEPTSGHQECRGLPGESHRGEYEPRNRDCERRIHSGKHYPIVVTPAGRTRTIQAMPRQCI